MAMFDSLIGDTAGRFGLGPNAGPLVRETLNMVANSPGGISGFLGRLQSAGLGPEMESWLGRPDAAALPAQELERALGSKALGGIANRLGLGESAVSSAVGYTLPKLIGALTPGGEIPANLPSEAANFLSLRAGDSSGFRAAPQTTRVMEQQAIERTGPRRIDVIHDESHLDEPQMARWLWPLLGALAVLGLGTYLFTRANRPASPVAVQPPAVQQSALPVPALAPRLTLSNDGGIIHYSGYVHDEETRASIINSLKAVYGADRIQGDIGIDLNRGAAPWLANFRTALESVKVPGLQTEFDGNSINLGGIVSDAERDRISNSLKSVLGGGLVFGTLSDKINDLVSGANAKAAAALTSLRTGFNANDLTGVLNQSIINFPARGAELPSAAAPLLRDAAAQIKQLPPGTVLEISGHTDNMGDAATNIALSQQRADAVRNFLIQAGVEPSMLVAKGYGSANPVGSNDLLEGRFRNRRIEYRVHKS